MVGGEGFGGGGAEVMAGEEGGMLGTGDESELVDETGRAEGGHKTEVGCQQCLRLSLFSSHAGGDGSEMGKEVEGDGGWA